MATKRIALSRTMVPLAAALLLQTACAGEAPADEQVDGGAEATGEAMKPVGEGTAEPTETAELAPDVAAELEALVAALYADPLAVDPVDPPLPMTDALATLFEAERDAADANEGMAPTLDYAWHVDGQDAEITELDITNVLNAPDQADVVAQFRNFGEPRTIRYRFARPYETWLLDDIIVEGDGPPLSIAQTLGGQ